ncbi:MAG: hypothetical protein ACJAS4_000719 [Bacteriovoracaceae bacterium]|jgi:hypothetical protein
MEKTVYIVSRYINSYHHDHYFHFVGYFNGVRINKIVVRGGNFELGEDYVLALNKVKCKSSILYGKLVKSKKLFI